MEIPDCLTRPLRNVHTGQGTTVGNGHGTTEWIKIWERSISRLYTVTVLINLYAEYIMQNAGLYEAQAGIKIARRNINNLRYADDTTLMAES